MATDERKKDIDVAMKQARGCLEKIKGDKSGFIIIFYDEEKDGDIGCASEAECDDRLSLAIAELMQRHRSFENIILRAALKGYKGGEDGKED